MNGTICLVLALQVSAGCGLGAERRYQGELSRTPAGGQHAVHSERLQSLMRSLDGLVHDRLPKSLDVAPGRRLRVEEIASVARELADSAPLILDSIAPDDLGESDRAAFAEMTAQLRDRAARVGRADGATTPDELRSGIAAIEQSCKACHDRFRTVDAGVLPQ